MTSTRLARTIGSAVTRMRLIRAFAALFHSALGAAVLVCLALLWHKLQPLPPEAWQAVGLCAAGVLVLGVLAGLLRPVSKMDVARLIDVRLGLDDRVASALEYSHDAQATRFMSAHIAETERRLESVPPRDAFPLRVPRSLYVLPVVLVLAGVLFVMPGYRAQGGKTDRPPAPAKLAPMRAVDARAADGLLALDAVKRDAKLSDVLREVKSLYADLREGKLTRDEALSRIGQVEARLAADATAPRGETAQAWRKELERALAEKGAELRKAPFSADVGRALADMKLDDASKESRSLAEAVKPDAPRIKLTPEQSEALSKVLENASKVSDRTLDVLSKEMGDASRSLSAGDLEKFAKGLCRMADEIDRLKEEMEKLKGLAGVGSDLEELKESVAAMGEGEESMLSLGPAEGRRDAAGYLEGEGLGGRKDDKEGAPGVGTEKADDGTGGPSTKLDSKRTPKDLTGLVGEGASLVEVVKGAASEGVATTAYREVAEAAARSAEEALHGEDIPLGYRLFIKRYFQLIRPPASETKENR